MSQEEKNAIITKMVVERERCRDYLKRKGTPPLEILAYCAGMDKGIEIMKSSMSVCIDNPAIKPRMVRGSSE